MQSHIMESYAILDNLQYMLSAKDVRLFSIRSILYDLERKA